MIWGSTGFEPSPLTIEIRSPIKKLFLKFLILIVGYPVYLGDLWHGERTNKNRAGFFKNLGGGQHGFIPHPSPWRYLISSEPKMMGGENLFFPVMGDLNAVGGISHYHGGLSTQMVYHYVISTKVDLKIYVYVVVNQAIWRDLLSHNEQYHSVCPSFESIVMTMEILVFIHLWVWGDWPPHFTFGFGGVGTISEN